mgnify:FL=1
MITTILVLIVGTALLTICLNIKPKDIKKLKQISEDKELNQIVEKFPEDKQICKEILKQLENENVTIEEDNNSKTSLYLVMQNKILIGKINSFARIQTIAHECAHSVQNKVVLKSNYVISNINNLFFIILIILRLLKILNSEASFILITAFIVMQVINYIIRGYLETEAMVKAEYVAKEYIEKSKITNETENKKITNGYREINKIGVKLYNYTLILKSVVKIIIAIILVH